MINRAQNGRQKVSHFASRVADGYGLFANRDKKWSFLQRKHAAGSESVNAPIRKRSYFDYRLAMSEGVARFYSAKVTKCVALPQ